MRCASVFTGAHSPSASLTRMGKWAESKVLTSKCWSIIRTRKYLMLFPVIGMLLAMVPVLGLGIPAAIALSADNHLIGWPLIVLAMIGAMVVGQFCTAALVACADEELHDRPSSLGHGFNRAASKFGHILSWSLINVVVSALVSLIRGNNQGGMVENIVRNLAAVALDVAWQVVTFFVLPFIMLGDLATPAAMKASASLVKKVWGNQIRGGVRIGGIVLLLGIIPSILAMVGGGLLTSLGNVGAGFGIPLMILGLIALVCCSLLVQAMRSLFAVALFRYAEDSEVIGGFTESELKSAVRTKSGAAA